jgi:hypothetical protein
MYQEKPIISGFVAKFAELKRGKKRMVKALERAG